MTTRRKTKRAIRKSLNSGNMVVMNSRNKPVATDARNALLASRARGDAHARATFIGQSLLNRAVGLSPKPSVRLSEITPGGEKNKFGTTHFDERGTHGMRRRRRK